jgi:hypothetical protein
MTVAGAGTRASRLASRPLIRRLAWGLAGLGALTVAGLVAVAIAAARYQPLTFGSSEQMLLHSLPGLPAGQGITMVNTFGRYREDIYVPPQRGAFSLLVTVANNGSHSVTIVSAAPPPGLRSAGPARYLASGPPVTQGGRQVWRVLHDYQLRPGAEMEIGMPMRTWPCAQLYGWQAIPDFDVRMRFAGFARTVQLPWGMSGDALIMRQPGGVPGEPGTFCLPGTILPPPPPGSQPPGDQLAAISGMIVRIHQAGKAGDLRLTRLATPDAASGFNNPACLVTRPPGQRLANFDLNWAAIAGQHASSPAVHLSITGPHGEPVTALIPQGPGYTTLACRDARNLVLPAQPPEAQFILGLVLRRVRNEWLRTLRVTIDGHTTVLPLTPVCEGHGCFTGSPAIRYQPGTPYSHALRI